MVDLQSCECFSPFAVVLHSGLLRFHVILHLLQKLACVCVCVCVCVYVGVCVWVCVGVCLFVYEYVCIVMIFQVTVHVLAEAVIIHHL